MLATLNEYSGLINFVLFGAIVGFLFHLQKSAREALNDKFETQLETLRSKIMLMELQEKATLVNHQAAIKILEQHLSFYKSVADLPEDQKVMAIKSEYQQKLSELEAEMAKRSEVEDDLKSKLAEVHATAQEAARAPSMTQQGAMRILEKVIRVTIDSLT